MKTVAAADLCPTDPWVCECCDRVFEVGDSAFGVLEAMTSDGTPIEGSWRCTACWAAEATP